MEGEVNAGHDFWVARLIDKVVFTHCEAEGGGKGETRASSLCLPPGLISIRAR